MNNSELVSVVIPCYNHGEYINEAIGSIISQKYTNWEIIIVDDGSTDKGTIAVLGKINHPRIKIIHKENGHLSSARNCGFRESKGDYILTLDADDKFHPD